MEKRTILAIIISLFILLAYQYFFAPAPLPEEQSLAQQDNKDASVADEQKSIPSGRANVSISDASLAEKEVRVETDLYSAVFTSRGGTLKSTEIKQYKDQENRRIILKGDDILPPLSLGMDDSFQFGKVYFHISGTDLNLSPAQPTGSLTFEYAQGDFFIRRTYIFNNTDYSFELKQEIRGLNSYWMTIGRDLGIYEKDDTVHYGPVILRDADRMEFVAKGLDAPKSFTDGVKWISQEDKYFFAAIVPKSRLEEAKVWRSNGDALIALRMPAGVNNYLVYAGPKEYDTLQKLGVGLEYIVDFGFFSFLAVPLFWILKLFYSAFQNYGVAIIFLTILVRIPFIPLINKGQKSMKKLQDIQPKMAEIKEKYKKDPQKMQKELMELYKKNKVNPMGGCLPMLLQIPVFFALYKVLLIAIELRGAPFVLWIHDLSIKDPYYILPIVMGLTMVIQQKMTPSTMEPMQQKIMMLMPVVFTFLFLTFPSGLVLYWLVNNVLSIAQQLYVNKKMEKQPA